MHAMFQEMLGQRAPRPYHVVVNGWYFYSINWCPPAAMLRNLPGMLWHLVRNPRAVAGFSRRPCDTASRSSSGSGARTCSLGIARRSARPKARVETLPVDELARPDRRAGRCSPASTSPRSRPWPARRTRWRSTSPGSTAGHLGRATGRQPPAAARRLRSSGRPRQRMRSARSTGGTRRSAAAKAPAPPTTDHDAAGAASAQAAEAAAFAASSPRHRAGCGRSGSCSPTAQHLVPMREEQRRADDRLAGHAAGGAAHRRGARRPRRASPSRTTSSS